MQDGTIATLVSFYADAALAYAACQAKHAVAVASYNSARQAAMQANGPD